LKLNITVGKAVEAAAAKARERHFSAFIATAWTQRLEPRKHGSACCDSGRRRWIVAGSRRSNTSICNSKHSLFQKLSFF